MATALITGASSGLGAEFARQLAARGADLMLVARDREALQRVAVEARASGVEAEVLVADLLVPEQRDAVIARVTDPRHPIELLINNAGFGLPLAFERNDIEDEVRHLRLHVEEPMRLMHAALQPMLDRGHGRIVNVASVAAFMPRSTYGAVKGWTVAFSRWANTRYAPRGVTVTAVCPGFTHTNFHERMGLAPGREGIASWMWLDAADVVAESLRDAARGRSVSVPSVRYKVMTRLVGLLPDRVSASLGQKGR
ncbi:SDR family NAD(P)-dependent oxidoreductase [Microbacterium fluvii]|uniref:SDR family NAD(P)-dependent oxidoreductase n=1 Tax=Microbacterium fluvii TaxID=415215 RepID=A0ABW2HH59_9MICO|nr:SDR family NAD(P)-dependent oxidoreductase [Microbacterium fluvii]MCU4673486.1 SDR family NAD(P)-dependent oxidoreductase [Microbacterium fluvii]